MHGLGGRFRLSVTDLRGRVSLVHLAEGVSRVEKTEPATPIVHSEITILVSVQLKLTIISA
jgi:hypothetical protein